MYLLKIFFVTLTLLLPYQSYAQNFSANDGIPPFSMDFFRKPLPIPPTEWFDEKGNLITIDDFRGKVVLLNVWATWCKPCVYEMPSLNKLQRRYKKAGLEVVAVATEQKVPEVRTFFRKKRIRNLKIYVDPSRSISKGYKVETLPTSFLISRKGEVIAMLNGAEDWFAPAARKVIEDELRWIDKPKNLANN